MSQDKPLFEVEVQPPTPEEIERQRVREEYRAKLAEKLKDPEFRKIEGFPIGTDEAILALSDPPYYTACPNPFIEEWLKEHGKPFDPDTDDYHREPFAADVSEGKNHPIYSAHSYHTKVPHRAIMRYILHYTEPGDVVYDGFCGTGMTGVAAQLCGDRDEVSALGYHVADDGCIWESEPWEAKQALESGQPNPYPHIPEPRPCSKLGTRRAILNDLSPAATFIAYNYNVSIDPARFSQEGRRILNLLEEDCGWMYSTLHAATENEMRVASKAVEGCSSVGELRHLVESLRSKTSNLITSDSKVQLGSVSFTVWSEVFLCQNCGKELVFSEVAVDPMGTVLEEFSCPHCGTVTSKKQSERATTTFFDPVLGTTVTQTKQVPALVSYKVSKAKHLRPTNEFDVALISKLASFAVPSWFPSEPIMGKGEQWGDTYRAGYCSGISHTHHFYTHRSLWTLAHIRELCQTASDQRVSKAVAFMYEQWFVGLSRQNRYSPHHFSQNNRHLSGTIYFGSQFAEVSPSYAFTEKFKRLIGVFGALPKACEALIETRSATQSTDRTDFLDYVFVDPPFGGNLQYSELNFLTEAWLGVKTNNATEAVTSTSQRKQLPQYQSLMARSFEQLYRSLKAGRWMTVEFHNSANSVWNAIQEALERVGFVVADVRIIDKSQYSFNQVNTAGATKKDLVISCYKPAARFVEVFERDKGTPQGVREFVEQHLEMLPVATTTSTGTLECLAERTLGVLFDRMIAYHLVRGARIPLSASEFRILLEDLCYERDGMYFLPSQVVRYDALKSRGIEVEQLSIFVRDEKSAVQWVRNELEQQPHTLGELTPKFMQASQDWGQHEVMPELRDLLQQYFIREDDETWVVPDPDNEKHLEEVRRKAMLREFMEYVRRPGQLKLFRTEAVLAGFAHCWETKQYDVIVGVCEKIPPKVLQEIQDLVMFYDIAKERAPEKVTQFEFKWE